MTCFRALQERSEADFKATLWEIRSLKARWRLLNQEFNELTDTLKRLNGSKKAALKFRQTQAEMQSIKRRLDTLMEKFPEAFK